jgi:hypothetical protein
MVQDQMILRNHPGGEEFFSKRVRHSSQLRNDAVTLTQAHFADRRLQLIWCFLFCTPAAFFTLETIRNAVLFGSITQRFIKVYPLHGCAKLTQSPDIGCPIGTRHNSLLAWLC